jgi:hypothetical protein
VSLAKKMYLSAGIQVPCVNLPFDADLDDLHPWASDFATAEEMVRDGKVPSLFVFAETSKQLKSFVPKLIGLWERKVNFWVFYPKKPHLNTDLNRDVTWELLRKGGLSGTRQVAVGDNWSCLYYKNTGKPVMPNY